jgi:hypothetical protein
MQGMEQEVHPFVLDEMAVELTEFCSAAILKFFAGQKEHGGCITTRDLDKEIAQENIDLFWYIGAKKWKEKRHIMAQK